MLLPLPDGVTFEQGGLARLAGIAMQGVRLARVRLGDHGVVFGQGLVGQFARQLLVIDGAATAIAVDPVDARLEVAARHGATHTVNPQRAAAAERVAAITAGHGADVVIEATGSPAVAVDALKVAAELGRVVLLGSPRGRAEIDLYHDIHSKGVSLIGAHVRTAPGTANAHYRWTRDEQQLLALELMRQGRLVTDGLVTHRVPAAAALDVYETLLAGPQDRLGVIITWPED
jgi:threonine dehydrogenase-like Zn-dependent dehydrogenase